MNTDAVIRALAEALWPALQPAAGAQQHETSYLSTSGAECPQMVQEVNKIIDKHLYGPNQTKLKLLLQLMTHRLPMLLLAGQHCLSPSCPFVLSLPEMTVAQRQAMLSSWRNSPSPDLRQAYKGVKAIVSAALLSHIDPRTNTNPFYEAMGFLPGNRLSDAAVGPQHAAAAELEEVIASAAAHLPDLLANKGAAGAQAYLAKRGFITSPRGAAATGHSSSSDSNKLGTSSDSNKLASSSSSSSSDGSIQLYYDAVIVGSGAGGGVTAAVLAQAGLKVLVLEKSTWVRSKEMTWLEHEAFDAMYERAGFMSTDDGGVTLMAGSTLGGGTKINWCASLKPPQHVRSEWAAAPHGLTHLGPDSQAFDAALDTVCSKLGVCTGTPLSAPNLKLAEGLSKLGLHVEDYPRNCKSKMCSAHCNLGCRSGHKQSSEVFLQDAVRAGAHILTGVQAHQVLTESHKTDPGSTRNKKAVGVEALVSTSSTSSSSSTATTAVRVVVHAPIVVSSCGSIHTPALLLRSGISVGGNVGSNLRVHPAAGLVAVFPRTAEQAAAGRGAVEMHKGLSMGVFSRAAANWGAGGYGSFISVPACQPGLLAAILPDPTPGYMKELMARLQDISTTIQFTRDSSGGRVKIDKEGRPVVSYWPCPTTRQHMMEGTITAMRALVAAGAEFVMAPNVAERWELAFKPDTPQEVRQQQLEALAQRMRESGIRKYDTPLFSAHQMGSCRMGSSRSSSACDPSGEVWDVSGLYVADGSVFPTPSGVNPMITIYGVAYLTAQGIVSRWKQQVQPARGSSATSAAQRQSKCGRLQGAPGGTVQQAVLRS